MSGPDGENLNFTFNGPLPTKAQWTGPVSGAVNFSYGTSLRPASENVNGLLSIAYTFDGDGYLTSAGAAAIGRSAQNGSMTSLTVGSMAEAYTYDQYGDVATDNVTFNGAAVFGATYTRDALARIAEETQSLYGGPLTTSFTYDTAGRLTRAATSGGNTRSYTYDANGNRLTRTTGTTTESAAYDEQDRLISFGNTTFTWADSGELKTRTDASGTTTYTYDVLGNLRKVLLPDGRVIEYVIDAANHRVGKRIDGALVQGLLYAADTRIVAQLDASNQLVSRFVYGSRGNVPDYMVRGGVTYRIIYDFRGSPRLVVNSATGAVAQEIGYDEFGNVLFDSAPGFQPFGFAGGLYDPDTHLIRFGVRDYDPTTGRWTAKDPILFGGGSTNLYGYTFGDPVNLIDPDGMRPLTQCVQQSLSKFFPDIDLSKVDVRENTKWLSRRFLAMTVGNTIYFRGAAPDTGTVTLGGMGTIAHELTHVEQYQDEGGVFWFLDRYTSDVFKYGFDHDSIPYEQEAIRREQAIRNQLQRNQGSTYCGCP